MANNIQKAMECQNLTAAELARRSGVPYGTVYDVSIGKTKVAKMAVEKFLKIAHGLGMTAEELYYGEERPRAYADARQGRMNEQYEEMNERGRRRAADSVEDIHANPANLKSAELEADRDPLQGVA